MKKLLQTIDTLSKHEKRSFNQWLASPFFNQRDDVTTLYQWLLQHPKTPIDAAAFSHLYSGAAFDGQQLRLVSSYLQRQAEAFLAYQRWRNSMGAFESDLAKEMRHRGLENHFKESLRTAKQVLGQQPLRNSEYHSRLGQVLWEEARFESHLKPSDVTYLEQLSNNADLGWILQKLRYLCLNRMQQTMYTLDHVLPLRTEVEAIILHRDLLANTAVATWYYCLKMLEEPEAPHYFGQFKQSFLGHNQLFNDDEIRDLYLFALNYCIRRVNVGQKSFFHDIMGFYKDGLQKGYILDNGVLSRSTYHNIVAAGLQTLEFEWVEDFIVRYQNSLERTHRDSSFSFNKARLEFARKRYDNALALLQHAHYYDPLLNLTAKTMSLKIYYELGEYDLLQAHLEALKNYIRRKVTLGYHRTNYLNLVKYTQKLVTVNRFSAKDVAQLKGKIQVEPVLTEREWLLEQFEND